MLSRCGPQALLCLADFGSVIVSIEGRAIAAYSGLTTVHRGATVTPVFLGSLNAPHKRHMKPGQDVEFAQRLTANLGAVEQRLAVLLQQSSDASTTGRLADAMRYSTLGGGKRFRPFLALETAALYHVTTDAALNTAAAIECVHCYSLVHDDLPAMDDDDLRRGRPTVHKAFDEATAILAGDSMLTLAFEILARPETSTDPVIRSDLVIGLAQASGWQGMAGGQMLDLLAEHETLDIEQVKRIHRLKTGALIEFSVVAGAILGRAPVSERAALTAYAQALGLAFQIADDLLDAEGDAADVGKATGKDSAGGKSTFVSVLGIEGARATLEEVADDAVAHLACFGDRADVLREAAQFVRVRNR